MLQKDLKNNEALIIWKGDKTNISLISNGTDYYLELESIHEVGSLSLVMYLWGEFSSGIFTVIMFGLCD